ncbi:acid-sensing ion channel 1-like isoform X1 [Hydra vulgaris]|uniref:Hydra sodium channel 11 n=1 Tax=Hydra vulgaris TaxID=6087 RepID=A0A0A0MP55_HYDVU|nr:acid-sensing ion channel 1-like [Hydra vulgaris]XP_012557276.1 acid-sensing ion channel 1-like isoform X1 [Hydra vulgaris]XP_012557277.1 acid-sensing ion channel 1-like isoform X1 [Hydra vulgaris]XP_012557278.1 acid-sensing ion channel 1-like isoform X1 [Hydra vulgaris]XP_012557279.1 acid-sensing ion channel 1-like isoform X1 [Hydra vulgaris]XP_012557280.1 acid-sensing ion channel 1-like isoform X1 [Hydra vulgaris]XP_047135819.1 acid-sensing ion channel 1-like isoform X1 [Hydra vulgaris]X
MLNFKDIAQITVEAIQETNEVTNKDEKNIQTIQDLRNKKIREHISYMIDNSSFHGLSYIFDKRHSVRRTIWFFITIAAFAYAMQKVYESTMNYFSYPFYTVRMRMYVNQIDFPAISFCNLNDIKFSAMNGTIVDDAVVTQNHEANITGEEYRSYNQAARHTLNEMLVDCDFEGKKCSHKNFTEFSWMQGESCFTFNSGKPPHTLLKVKGAGINRSLKLTINVQHYDYYRDKMDSGIRLILHGQDETPVKMSGLTVPPGFTTYIQIEKKTIINLEAPYKTKCGSVKLKYFDSYSMHTCWLEQLTDYVYKTCNCKDYFMPGDIPICSFDLLYNCAWPEWETFDKQKLYQCPLPCKIDSYEVSLSRALFPTGLYASSLANDLRKYQQVPIALKSKTDELIFMRENLLRLVIYYDDLAYELVEQKPSYNTLLWLGDVGGQIGLFIGAGVMSYFEFIDCLAMVIYTRFFEKISLKNPTTV